MNFLTTIALMAAIGNAVDDYCCEVFSEENFEGY